MKAIIHNAYGPPHQVLRLHDVDVPRIGAEEVLVEVHASAVGGRDGQLVRGEPFVARLATGLRRPAHRIPGRDVAGRVLAVGASVTAFRPGDEVFGQCAQGAFAECAAVAAANLERKPANLSFAQAAVLPVAGSAALRAISNAGVRAGQRVIVIGASGGVGTLAVQIAKAFGATVTGVCSTSNIDLVRAIGADDAVDYTLVDVTDHAARFDAVIDLVGHRSTFCNAVVRLWTDNRLDDDRLGRDLAVLKRLAETRQLTPVVSAHFSLADVPAALSHFARGHARGKVAITI